VGSTLYLLLSDGMGSGEAAHREAAMTVRLLQQFLKAGIDASPALKTLNTALSLRGESGGGFTTIDLLAVHRQSGEAVLYKYGAAPSYLKKTGSVMRITGQSLPAGLQESSDPPECTHLSLPSGSFLVMVSDGVADETDDEWLQNLLAGWNGRDCNTLVSLIMSESRTRKGLVDDCAVLALQMPDSDLGQRRQV
jgi:stage II sporulation protein E